MLPHTATFISRLAICALALIGLFTFLALVVSTGLVDDEPEEPAVVEEGPGTWRDGFCIYICEPINGPALDHHVWRQEPDDRWICECSDGHLYVIPEEMKWPRLYVRP